MRCMPRLDKQGRLGVSCAVPWVSREHIVRHLLSAAIIFVSLSAPSYAGTADEMEAAQKSATSMASAIVCKSDIPQDVKQSLYAKILKFYDTPSMVNHIIKREVDELTKMGVGDRDAMCGAIRSVLKN